MTTVETVYSFATPPTESLAFALADVREVYGIRKLKFDSNAGTLCVEYDATRLDAATVKGLIRQAGVDVVEEVPEDTRLQEPAAVPAR